MLFLSAIVFFPLISSTAQDTTSSLAFKKNRPNDRPGFFYYPDLAYQLWQQFNLIKEANAGNALAQHELGIRYILGEGVPADTVKGAYWIHKAAEQNLPGACYNYAILLNNGWGVAWNPFKAFKYLLDAAKGDMPQAEYVVGLEYTDDLVVKRDWGKAYLWIKKSASEGFAPAKKTLTELVKFVDFSNVDTAQSLTENVPTQTLKTIKSPSQNSNFNNSSLSPSLGLVFIDFGSKRDTSLHFSNQLLISDLLHDGNEKLDSVLHITEAKDTSLKIDSSNSKVLLQFADAGSPEALTLLGRFYETGYFFPKDLLMAAVCYVQATRLDSPRSPYLLWEISRKTNFYNELKNLVEANDPRAMYIWYGLYLIKFDNQFTADDAIKLLERSASLNYIPALNELGLDYYTGKFVKQNKKKAIAIWNNAEKMGSSEAKLRLAVATIYDATDNSGYAKAVKKILDSVNKGSVLAQATLAYCYQFGFGIEQSIPEAVRYYRMAAQRGSSFAYSQLKQLYNSVRPSDPLFNLN